MKNDIFLARFLKAILFYAAGSILLGIGAGELHLWHSSVLGALEGLIFGAATLYAFWPSGGRLRDMIGVYILIVMALRSAYDVLHAPTADFDTLAFHLPIALGWLRTNDLAIISPWNCQLLGHYPYGFETWCATLIAITHRQQAGMLPNVAAMMLFTGSVYLLARAMKAHPAIAAFFAILLSREWVAARLLDTMHTDLLIGALFVFGLYLAVSRDRSMSSVSAFVLILGLLPGVKMNGFALDAVLVVAAGAEQLFHRGQKIPLIKTRWTSGVKALAAGITALGTALTAAIIGAFWYARNYIESGNPLWDVQVALGAHVLFHGTATAASIAPSTLAAMYNPDSVKDQVIYGAAVSQSLGDILPELLRIGCLLSTLLLFRRGERVLWLIAGAVTWLCWLVYQHTPYSATDDLSIRHLTPWVVSATRYALPFLGCAAALAAAGLSEAGCLLWLAVKGITDSLGPNTHEHK